MSKISTVSNARNLNITSGSAWARGPPPTSPSSTNNISQPAGQAQAQAQAPTQTPAPVPPAAATVAPVPASLNQSAVPPRINGQSSHSRRSSAAYQSSSTTLKDPVAVSKSVGQYFLPVSISTPLCSSPSCQALSYPDFSVVRRLCHHLRTLPGHSYPTECFLHFIPRIFILLSYISDLIWCSQLLPYPQRQAMCNLDPLMTAMLSCQHLQLHRLL